LVEVWRFVHSGRTGALTVPSSPLLVLLSLFVAAFAAYTALAVVNRVVATPSGRGRRAWLLLGAVAMGGGIWAMHFIAMLAYRIPLPTSYHLGWTLASVLPGMLGSGLALHTMARDRIRLPRLLGAGFLVAVGIGTMHYSGMEAVTVDAAMNYDPILFGLSIVVAFVLATVALYTRFALPSIGSPAWRRLGGAALLGGAVSGMHYTAMAAVHFVPTGAHHIVATGDKTLVAILILVFVSIIIGLALLGTIVDQRLTTLATLATDSRERHRRMLAAIPEGVLTIGPSGLVLVANPAAERMLGYPAGGLVGKSLLDLFELTGSLAAIDRTVGDVAALVQALGVRPGDARGRRLDQSTFPAELRIYQLNPARQDGFDLLLIDMSVIRAAEAERRRLAAALQQAADAIFIADLNGVIEFVNPAFERITGYRRDEIIGKTPRLLKSGDQDPEFYDALWTTIRRGDVWTGFVRNRAKDGSSFEVTETISPVRDETGSITHFVAVCHDMTDQRSLELQLRQAQKLEAIGQLAAGVAHEINTPTQYVGDNIRFLRDAFTDLSGVLAPLRQLHQSLGSQAADPLVVAAKGALERADTDYLVAEIPKAIDQALDGVTRISRIVRAMKEFSHPGGGKGLVDLNHAIDNTVTVATNEWKYVADVEIDLDPALPPVPCAVGEINQVVLNLIVNAVHAIEGARGGGGGKGHIRITTRHEGGSAVIRIADDGTGIPDKVRARVFEPFFTTKEVGRGTGQGLALAHAVVTRKHGGTIDFDTELGKGTTFTVRLPLQPSREAAA
jgi:PAS domain S-box-containing protein